MDFVRKFSILLIKFSQLRYFAWVCYDVSSAPVNVRTHHSLIQVKITKKKTSSTQTSLVFLEEPHIMTFKKTRGACIVEHL